MQIVVNNSAEYTGQLRAVFGSAPEQPWPASALTPSGQSEFFYSLSEPSRLSTTWVILLHIISLLRCPFESCKVHTHTFRSVKGLSSSHPGGRPLHP